VRAGEGVERFAFLALTFGFAYLGLSLVRWAFAGLAP